MNIETILKELNVPYTCENNKVFETLGLVQSDLSVPYCTFLTDLKYAKDMNPYAVVILTTTEIAAQMEHDDICICTVEAPRRTFFMMHNYLGDDPKYIRPSFETTIGENCNISPLACIAKKNVRIGNNVVIEEFVSIKENTTIGNDCTIRTGCVLGKQGFEFKEDENGNLFPTKHLGGFVVKDHVEIQQYSCIDKAVYPWDNTVIGEYSKIDNLVHIAHGVKIGKNTMIVANSGLGGRVTVGDNCWIGFGATIRNGVKIGNCARANMGAVVTRDIADDEAVSGNFAIEHHQFLKNLKDSISE